MSSDDTARRRIPATVQIVFWLIIAALAVDTVVAILRLLRAVDVLDGTAAPISGRPENGAQLLTVAIVTFAMIALEIFVLFKMRGGRNWARIVITILEALSLLALFVDTTIIGLIGPLVSVLIIILLWVKPSNTYFHPLTAP